MGGPVASGQRGERGRLEARRDHGTAALGQHGVQAGGPTRVEEERDVLEVGAALGHGELGHPRPDGGDGVGVREHGGLRVAGRARRRPQHVRRVGGELGLERLGPLGVQQLAPVEEEGVGAAEADDMRDGDLLEHGSGQRGLGGVDGEGGRFDDAEVGGEVGSREADVQGRADEPARCTGEEVDEVLAAVRRQHGDAITRCEPETLPAARVRSTSSASSLHVQVRPSGTTTACSAPKCMTLRRNRSPTSILPPWVRDDTEPNVVPEPEEAPCRSCLTSSATSPAASRNATGPSTIAGGFASPRLTGAPTASRWAFAERGLARGDRVALLAANDAEFLEIQVGAQRAGVVLVPLNYRLALPELAWIVEDCAPALAIVGTGHGEVGTQLPAPDFLHYGGAGPGDDYEEVVLGTDPLDDSPALEADTAATVLYTSGTTGKPKGAVLTNLAVWARCYANGAEIRVRPGDVFCQTLPMFHIAANLAYAHVHAGATLVLQRAFDPVGLVKLMSDESVTQVLLVPTTINVMVNLPGIDDVEFPSLRMVQYGASPIAPELLRRALRVFRCEFLQFFGMTETSGCSLLRPEDHDPDDEAKLASAGTDATGFETRVVDADDRPVGPGVVGEIVTRGPAVMREYWNRPVETAEALRGGWMHTGDLGYRDERGYLHVSDRLKDMIVTGGENVYPREVEDVLFAHPAVLDAAVIGVPDTRWGERVHAVIVLRPGADVSADELSAHVRARLAGYKVPKTVEFVDDLPKNVTGKVLKRELRASYT